MNQNPKQIQTMALARSDTIVISSDEDEDELQYETFGWEPHNYASASEIKKEIKQEGSACAENTHFQSVNWCFTAFKKHEWQKIWDADRRRAKPLLRYLCVGRETCPDTKRVHDQGWCQFTTKRTLSGAQRILMDNHLHMEACRGTEQQNNKYCGKGGKVRTWGAFIKQGHRSDVSQMKTIIDNGGTMWDVAQENFMNFLKFHKGMKLYMRLSQQKAQKKWRDVEVILIKGPTGTNKTRWAMSVAQWKICGPMIKWWDDYGGEKIICIDEYSNQIPICRLLNLLDGYTLRLPVKNDFAYANWDKVVITTNLRVLHANALQEHRDALDRRISKVYNLYDSNELAEWNFVFDS